MEVAKTQGNRALTVWIKQGQIGITVTQSVIRVSHTTESKNTSFPHLKNNKSMIRGLNIILLLLARFQVAIMWIPLIHICMYFSEAVAEQ